MNDLASGENSKVMGLLSLVFGIISITISWAPFGRLIIIALGIAAIVLGAIEIDRVNKNISAQSAKNMAIAGIVLGGLAIVFHIIMTVAWGLITTQWLFKGDHVWQWKWLELGRLRHLR